METAPGVPTGVQDLIARLRDQGVQAGKKEAEGILQEARAQAAQLLAQARAESDRLRAKAHDEIQAEQAAAREALQLAFRDTELRIQSELRAAFEQYVRRLVATELEQEDLIRQVILQIAGRAGALLPAGQPAEILLNKDWFAAGANAEEPSDEEKKQAGRLLLGISRDMLREGVELRPSGVKEAGVRIRLKGKDLEIDLRDRVLSDLLLGCLTPRYRAIAEGME